MSWNAIHSWSVGEILTAAAHNGNDQDLSFIPHEWDYAQITSPLAGITATTEATAVTVITGNTVAYDGNRVKLELFIPKISASGSLTATFVFVRDPAGTPTVIGWTTALVNSSSAFTAVYGVAFDTPSASSHAYAAKAFVSVGSTVTVNAGAGGSGNLVPAWLRVTNAKNT